ncbi:MAG: hypothetical protein B6I18_06805 [Bacteroidetes bacterium 4572_112]|nr:MAG: hypothetical protein B6I18_06805 [Bacteroidetes bacterium 4572_112]
MKTGLLLFFLFIISITINAQNVIIGDISVNGNNTTKESFIIRELAFNKGDTLSSKELNEAINNSKQNIVNTSLFNEVNISSNINGSIASISIDVKERWYLWPIPQLTIDERNFNTWLETGDLSRASAGVFLTHNNMRGRGEILKVLFMLGYNQKLGLSYEMPYLNKKKTFGMGFQSIYTLKHEVNAVTEKDKQVFLKTSNHPIQRDWVNAIQFNYRPKLYMHNALQIRHHLWEFSDTLVDFNPYYSPKSTTDLQYFSIYYKLKIDYRDYKPYPLNGFYTDIEALKTGLGILNDDVNIFSLKSTSRKYFNLSNNFYAAVGLIAKLSWGGFQPYVMEKGLGYGRDYIRGYEYYVIDGQDYAVIKTNIKYAIIPKKVFKLNWIPTEKFNTIPISIYLNVFGDAGYVNNNQVYDASNKLPNKFQYSGGLGIDLSTYYDSVVRIEWAVNAMGESRIYLHFIAPI